MYRNLLDFPFSGEWGLSILLVWVLVWDGLALWKAGRRGDKWWFVIMFVVNTFGIVEILYYFIFSEKKFNFNMKMKVEHDHNKGKEENKK
jgi:hypothetical protein